MYGVCCLLGLGTLLPWNLFITEKQYFDVRVQQPPTQAALADNFENIIVVSFQLMCVALTPADCLLEDASVDPRASSWSLCTASSPALSRSSHRDAHASICALFVANHRTCHTASVEQYDCKSPSGLHGFSVQAVHEALD